MARAIRFDQKTHQCRMLLALQSPHTTLLRLAKREESYDWPQKA